MGFRFKHRDNRSGGIVFDRRITLSVEFTGDIVNFSQIANEYLEKLNSLSVVKFLLIMFALMCVWKKLVHDGFLLIIGTIQHFSKLDLSILYTYFGPAYETSYFERVVLIPIIETVIFQFLIQNLLRITLKGHLSYLLLSTFLFSLAHTISTYSRALNAIGLGLAFALTYDYFLKRKNHLWALLSTFGLHAFWNALCSYELFL